MTKAQLIKLLIDSPIPDDTRILLRSDQTYSTLGHIDQGYISTNGKTKWVSRVISHKERDSVVEPVIILEDKK